MHCLIAGCGYVGTELAGKLINQGHEVTTLNRKGRNVSKLSKKGIHAIKGDIISLSFLKSLSGPFDWVVHCASSSGQGEEAFRSIFLEGTSTLRECIPKWNTRKILFTSSTNVYGQNDGSVVDELSEASHSNPRAKILRQAESIVRVSTDLENTKPLILRVAGIYGPGRCHLLKRYLNAPITLWENGQRYMNMIHRDDLVSIMARILETEVTDQVYNATDHEPVTQLDFYKWLAEELPGQKLELRPDQNPNPTKRGTTSKRVSNKKLTKDLGFEFRYPNFRHGYACSQINTLLETADRA